MIHVKIPDSLSEIDEPQFFKVDPLVQGVSAHLSLPAIVKGKSSGRIWVDSPSDPGIALIWDLVNGFLFIRKKPARPIDSSEVNHFLRETLIPLAEKSGKYTEMYVVLLSECTEVQVSELFKGLSFTTGDLHHFHLNHNISAPIIPPAFQLVRIDGEVLNEKIMYVEEINRCIKACWRSLEDYLKEGIGYLLRTGDTVVSWCSTDYVVSTQCELYVETFNGYRQKGFGTMVATACARECLNQNYELNWHCWGSNVGFD